MVDEDNASVDTLPSSIAFVNQLRGYCELAFDRTGTSVELHSRTAHSEHNSKALLFFRGWGTQVHKCLWHSTRVADGLSAEGEDPPSKRTSFRGDTVARATPTHPATEKWGQGFCPGYARSKNKKRNHSRTALRLHSPSDISRAKRFSEVRTIC